MLGRKIFSGKKLAFVLFAVVICTMLFVKPQNEKTVKAAFEAKHYDINQNGGTWDGTYYIINGEVIKDAFFCDGTYTYFLQADGTPMTDRLTYHPDGEHIIYFDAYGHEVFSDFATVKRSISGDPVNDLCFFDVYGYMYVNVLTYDKAGEKIYYANPYGVMECNGWFQFAGNAGGIAEPFGVTEGMFGYAYRNGVIDFMSVGDESKLSSYQVNDTLTAEADAEMAQRNADSVVLSKTSITLARNDTCSLELKNADMAQVQWTTSDTSVATVNGGNVSAMGTGSCTVTATYNSKTYICNVNVVGFELNVYGVHLNPGDDYQFSASQYGKTIPYKWSSSDTSIATVDSNGLVHAVPGKGGICQIRVEFYTVNGITYFGTDIFVEPLSSLYTIEVNSNNSYAVASGNATGTFTDGMKTDMTLLSSGIGKCYADRYEHVGDIDSVNKDGYNYYFVTDTWNNRVLIFRVAENKVWNGADVSGDIYCVLGQTDTTSSVAGYGLSNLNWPIGVAAAKQSDGKIKIFVTDTKNNRILVWNDLPGKGVNGKAADYSIMEMTDSSKCKYGTSEFFINANQSKIAWPWDIWTDGERLICTSTQSGYVMIWDKGLPSKEDKYPDKIIYTGGTPRTIICKGNILMLGDHNIKASNGTDLAALRVFNDISKLSYTSSYSKSNSSEKLFDSCSNGGDFTYTDYNSTQPSGVFLTKDLKTKDGTVLSAGTLILHEGGALSVWKDGKINSASDKPDYYIGGSMINSEDYYYFVAGDIASIIQDSNNNIYTTGINAGKILGFTNGTFPSEPAGVDKSIFEENGDALVYNGVYYWNNINSGVVEKHATDDPNICIGAKNVDETVPDSLVKYQNCNIASDGKYLAVLDDYNKRLCLWKQIPNQNNAKPDVVIKFNNDLEDAVFVEHDGKTGFAVMGRTRLYYWEDVNSLLSGKPSDKLVSDTIGTISVNNVRAIDYCDGYFYMVHNDSLYMYKGIPNRDTKPEASLKLEFGGAIYNNAKIHVTKCNDGNTYVGIAATGDSGCIVKAADILSGNAQANAKIIAGGYFKNADSSTGGVKSYSEIYRSFNGVSNVLVTKKGQVILVDGGFARVIVWNSIDDAVSELTAKKRKSVAILGLGSNNYTIFDVRDADSSNLEFSVANDTIGNASADTFYNPYFIEYDGTYLWVGDYKFSGGVKRFTGGF
ncbi:MAG: Ig-like domain-containing protein [Lachnospiraceae bacterium]|nr:Ig-like domain-containing protein [Lachnospiraceae bacterium]